LKISVEKRHLLASSRSREPEHPILTVTSDLEGPGSERVLLSCEILAADIANANSNMNLWVARKTRIFRDGLIRPLPWTSFGDLDPNLNTSDLQTPKLRPRHLSPCPRLRSNPTLGWG
jgi:hypothetical protein